MTVVPIGETNLYFQYQEPFLGWYTKRSGHARPKLDVSLLGLTLSALILQKLNYGEEDLERCYQEIVRKKKKIDQLKFWVNTNQTIGTIVFYLSLTSIPFLARFAILGGFYWGGVVIYLVLIYFYGFYLLFRFAFLDLIYNTDRSVQEIITYCRQLVKNSNIAKFDLIARLITLPLAVSGLLNKCFSSFLLSPMGMVSVNIIAIFYLALDRDSLFPFDIEYLLLLQNPLPTRRNRLKFIRKNNGD